MHNIKVSAVRTVRGHMTRPCFQDVEGSKLVIYYSMLSIVLTYFEEQKNLCNFAVDFITNTF